MDVNYRYTDYLRGAEKPSIEQSVPPISCLYCNPHRSFTSEKLRQQHMDRRHNNIPQERDREKDRERERDSGRERERERQRKSTGSPEGQLAHGLENQTITQPLVPLPELCKSGTDLFICRKRPRPPPLKSPATDRLSRGLESRDHSVPADSSPEPEQDASPRTLQKRRMHTDSGIPPRKSRIGHSQRMDDALPLKSQPRPHPRGGSSSSKNKNRRRHASGNPAAHRAAASSTPADQLDQAFLGTPSPAMSAKASTVDKASDVSPTARDPNLLLQPDSRPISQEQLASEVKSIYSALIMVENKCMHVDRTQAAAIQKAQAEGHVRLPNEHWQALTALHRTLLHEHHDFFLASQHPSASDQLRRLAAKYSMPARMWKHGIHSYLELLRHQLPESLEYMLSFIYLAYQMMALLLETVPSFEDTWIECLGDLGRYRMAIEDEDPRDRETWAGVARYWYTKAANKSPITGRLYHHLAILARPNALQQMYLYSRSLNCLNPFHSARDSVLTLLEPVLGRSLPAYPQLPVVDVSFLRLQSVLLERIPLDMTYWENSSTEYHDQLTTHIDRLGNKFRDRGAYTAITIIAAVCEFGWDGSILRCLYQCHGKRREFERDGETKQVEPEIPGRPRPPTLAELELKLKKICAEPPLEEYSFVRDRAVELALSTFTLMLQKPENEGVFSFVYIFLTFLVSMTRLHDHYAEVVQTYVTPLFQRVAWGRLCSFINTLITSSGSRFIDLEKIRTTRFLHERFEEDILPEDHITRGQVFAESLFSETWFNGVSFDDERVVEPPSTSAKRRERIVHATLALSFVRNMMRVYVATAWLIVCDRQRTILRLTRKAKHSRLSLKRKHNHNHNQQLLRWR